VPPLVAECLANLECKVVDTQLVNKFNLFILEVLKAWMDPAQKHPKTIHHHGYGKVRCGWRDDQAEVEETVGVLRLVELAIAAKTFTRARDVLCC